MSTRYYKYPRTPHLPWSPGATDDDIWLAGSPFEGQDVIVTEKMDGENTTLYRDHIHARSLDSRHHPSRDWVKRLQGQIGHLIPESFRICGENLYAQHSIAYENLASYFYVFSIWEDETCLSWTETEEWCKLLGLQTVPVLAKMTWDTDAVRELEDQLDLDRQEGYVVRVESSFELSEWGQSIGKWVRKNHVTTDEHWMHKEVTPNSLQ